MSAFEDRCAREDEADRLARTRSDALLDVAPSPDIATLEAAGESLVRHGDMKNAVALFAIALRLRMEATL